MGFRMMRSMVVRLRMVGRREGMVFMAILITMIIADMVIGWDMVIRHRL